jgi:integrase
MGDAVEEGMIARTPCRKLELPANEHIERRFLTEDEVEALIESTPPLHQALVFTAAYIGPRWEELAALKRARLDMRPGRPAHMRLVAVFERAGGTYRYTEDMKSRKARRTIRLPETAREALAAHLASAPDSEWVFPATEGGHLRYDNFRRRVWTPAVELAGLAPLTFHELRHTAAAFMIDDGADPYLVMRRLGHEDIRTTYNLYGHLFPDREQTVNEGLDRRARGARSRSLAASPRPERGLTVVEFPSGGAENSP